MTETNITVTTNNTAADEREITVRQILKISDKIFREIKLMIPSEWLTSDMTVAQLRVLLYLHTEGPCSMRNIAASLDVAISTATGIIDKLVRKNLVVRSEDPSDRRLVICSLAPAGKKLMDRIWKLGRNQLAQLLHVLSAEELKKAEEVTELILAKIKFKKLQSPE